MNDEVEQAYMRLVAAQQRYNEVKQHSDDGLDVTADTLYQAGADVVAARDAYRDAIGRTTGIDPYKVPCDGDEDMDRK